MRQILIVEDDEAQLFILNRILGDKYAVSTRRNGLAATKWLADGNFPDLIMSDLNMPLLNGLELIENLKSSGIYREIPIIVLTGQPKQEDQQRCIELGVDHFVTKPFNPESLHSLVSDVIKPFNHNKATGYE